MTQFAGQAVQQVNTTADGDQTAPSITLRADGGFAVIWNTGTGPDSSVYVQVFDPTGAKVYSEQSTFSDRFNPAPMWSGFQAGGVAGLSDGTFVVTASASWVDPNSGPRSEVRTHDLGPIGNAVGITTVVDGTGDLDNNLFGGPIIATADGDYWIEVRNQSRPTPQIFFDSYLQKFNAAGQPIGTQIQIPALASVVQMPNGNLFAAWQRDTTVSSALSWAVYDPTGQPITKIDQPFVGFVTDKEPTVTALANGTGVILWKHFENSVETWHMQRVDALGQPIGSASVLPLDGALDAQVTGLASGGFLLSWETAGSDEVTSQLLAQAYDANGHVSGGVMQIDSAVHMESDMAAFRGLDSYDIIATADGGFLLVSEDAQGDTGVDIDVQEFDPSAAGQIEVHGGVAVMPVGDYTVTGTTSLDTVAFGSAHTAYAVAKVSSGATVTGPEGHDLLLGVERVHFSDNFGMAFDVDGHAGQAWRLYQAAFDRQPDLPGLGYQMNALDIGLGLSQVAAHFIASPEFQTRYGSVDNNAFVTLLYQNVLDRDPEDAGLQYHLADLAAGLSRADVLTHFSESPENQANVIGQIESGMLYMFG